MSEMPKHVAIIMDGNGRWATARGLKRSEGHRKGAEATRKVVEAAAELGVKYLTLFAFSSENWNRPEEEVIDLMNLLRFYLKKEISELNKNNVRLLVIGDRSRLSDDIVKLIEKAEALTKDNDKITVTIALNYGGRQDIVFAAKEIAEKVKSGTLEIDEINENIFSQYLMTKDIPDPDVMIRTSGESRLSNFLMWQLAYTELYFTSVFWPDFSKEDIVEAIEYFKNRDRRYGGTSKVEVI